MLGNLWDRVEGSCPILVYTIMNFNNFTEKNIEIKWPLRKNR